MPPAGIWIDGLVQSSTYITMAFGMVLVFSILGILNWAHGQYYMLGAVVVFYGVTAAGVPFPFSMLVTGLIIAGLGMLVKKVIIDRVSGDLYVGAVTLALIFFFEGLASMLFGMQDKGLANVMPGSLDLGTFSVSYQKIAVVSFTLVVHDSHVYRAEPHQNRFVHTGCGTGTKGGEFIRRSCGTRFTDRYGHRVSAGCLGRLHHGPCLRH